MISMVPSEGRIVHFVMDEGNAASVNKRRADAHKSRVGQAFTGWQVHAGNDAKAGDVYPMLIVRVWRGHDGQYHDSNLVNGQVFLDGNDTLWITSVGQSPADEPMRPFSWHAVPRVAE